MAAGAAQRVKVERLCRYIARPAIATARLALTAQGDIRYTLRTPYRDGTTHVIFEPLDFIARLAALVPRPRVHLRRYHGVLAPHSALRTAITPAGRGAGTAAAAWSPAERHRAMSWAQRLKRVGTGLSLSPRQQAERCGGRVKVIASIEDPAVIGRMLAHLARPASPPVTVPRQARAPPLQAVLDLD